MVRAGNGRLAWSCGRCEEYFSGNMTRPHAEDRFCRCDDSSANDGWVEYNCDHSKATHARLDELCLDYINMQWLIGILIIYGIIPYTSCMCSRLFSHISLMSKNAIRWRLLFTREKFPMGRTINSNRKLQRKNRFTAAQAYSKGNPILSYEDFDALNMD